MATDSDEDPEVSWPIDLQKALTGYFSLEELQDLCLRLGIDFEELGEGGKTSRVTDLLRIAVANGRLNDLLDQCQALRPGAEVWNRVRAAAAQNPDLFDKQLEYEDDDASYQLSGDFRGATINIESGLLGGFFRNARNRRVTLAAVIALAILATGGALYALGVFAPEPIPDKMTDVENPAAFNIAVAEFAVLDANGNLTNSSHSGGRQFAGHIGQALRDEFDDPRAVAIWNDSPDLSNEHHVTIGVAADGIKGTRSPADVLRALDADVVIYGQVVPAASGSTTSLGFYLKDQSDQAFANIVADYALKARIAVADPTHPTDEVWTDLDPLTKSLLRLLQGLNLENKGELEKALNSFERAAQLTRNVDVLRFYVGQENLDLAQREDIPSQSALNFESSAEAAFAESLRLKPGNARGIVGLGSVRAVRAQRLLEAGKAPEFDGDPLTQFNAAISEAQRALETLEPVAELPDEQVETYGLPMRSIARLGQGFALRVMGDALYRAGDPAAAQDAISRALQTLESAKTPIEESRDYRTIARLYQSLGTVYLWQGFLDEQNGVTDSTANETALMYFRSCVETGDKSATDQYLRKVIIGNFCQNNIDTLENAAGGE